jgi:prevent-host-death family protein
MIKRGTGDLRANFADVINRVRYSRERVRLQRRGKDVAAIVPIEDLDLLELLEDRIDLIEARKALAEAKRKGQRPIAWEKAKRRLGL